MSRAFPDPRAVAPRTFVATAAAAAATAIAIAWACLGTSNALASTPADDPAETKADADGWIDLGSFDAYRGPTGTWFRAADVVLDPENPRLLKPVQPGPDGPVLVNGPDGRTNNLLTRAEFRDVEFRAEFLVSKGSNSGVKMNGLYEIQIFDSSNAVKLTGSDCGGIYPTAELLPRYRHLDEGRAPLVNACKQPGEWQTLEIVFRSPRFDDRGAKIADARFVKVALNGKIVQDDVAVATPTGHAHRLPEPPRGPILVQADHGPVAFRNIRVRELPESESAAAPATRTEAGTRADRDGSR